MDDLKDIVQFQADETPNTDAAFREFYSLSFAGKLDAIYELMCQIGGNEIQDGNFVFDGSAAGIQNGYDNAYLTMNYKEGVSGEDAAGELPG